MNHVRKNSGFTLIELMLAMAFISVLLLAIAVTIIEIGKTYNRGLTLKEVNQSARSISDEINRELSAAQAFSVDDKFVENSGGGRLCLGQYSYVWNYAKALQSNDENVTGYDEPADKDAIRFVKVADPAGAYCAQTPDKSALIYRDIRAVDSDLVTELLKSGDRTLSIHDFSISSSDTARDTATGQQLYTVSYIIGTGNVSALTEDQTSCLPPSNPESDFAYCTVQEFSLVARAGNRVN